MVVLRHIFAFVIMFGVFAFVPETYADSHIAASCNYADVSAAISAASTGDTISVPAGTCTWSSALTITKGISLLGTGIGKTVITSNVNGGFLITYEPSNYSLNTPFRLSGFTLNGGGKSMILSLGTSNKRAPFTFQTKVRVDHNRFQNSSGQYIWHRTMFGVADNNEFAATSMPIKADPGAPDDSWWTSFDITNGMANDNFYFEDNIFEGVSDIITDCQFAGRFAYRYNNIAVTGDLYPMFDMHGQQCRDSAGLNPVQGMTICFGGEIYGNNITSASNNTVQLLSQRAGRAKVFYNNYQSSGTYAMQTYDDAGPSVWGGENCHNTNSPGPNVNPFGLPQHVTDSYFWNNRHTLTGSLNVGSGGGVTYTGGAIDGHPLENADYFIYSQSFNGRAATGSGMGCGTLAQMNAFTTCSDGTGFWVTANMGSCSNLTGLVGIDPTTPISGTLYKCSANTWLPAYTPLAYPHPLRTDNTFFPAPTNLNILQ
jgi:hypothetical protein